MTDAVLQRLLGGVLSGQALSEELGVTRAAVWKQIERLRELGFEIEAQGRQGYRLLRCPDSLLAPVVRHGLSTRWAGCEVVHLDEVDSTNRYARMLAAQGAPQGTLVIAETQTAGRGRRGRGWVSPAGEGIFMSLILRPHVHPSQVASLSLQTALAVAEGIREATGLDALIKWPNDVVCSGKKLVGMLLEMNADEERVHDIVAGIGINVHQRDFGELAQTATSLDLLTGGFVSRAAVVRAVLEAFERVQALADEGGVALMDAYRARSATIGQRVRVIGADRAFTGVAQDVTPLGSLLVREDGGEVREVLAGDVSVRGLMGYV